MRFAISDIHGNAYEFLKLLDYVDPIPEQTIFLGDSINRGLDSYGVIEEINWFLDEGAEALWGNHEHAFVLVNQNRMPQKAFIESEAYMGITTVKSIEAAVKQHGHETVQEQMDKYFGKLKLYHETDDFIFTHAGLDPRLHFMNQQKSDTLMYGCPEWKNPNMQHSFDQYVVFGHTPTHNIHSGISEDDARIWMSHKAKKIAIDTGAGLRNRLTMVDLEEGIAYAYDFPTRKVIEYRFYRGLKGRR